MTTPVDPKAAVDPEQPKATSDAVLTMLDQIARTSRSGLSRGTAEMDDLRRMAEAVRAELLDERMIRSVGEAITASADDGYLDPASRDMMPASVAAPSNGSAAPRPASSAHAAQMRAYRENA